MNIGTSLRTRLFLTLGAVLAVSSAATGLLSRRATLVEIREVVSRAAPVDGFNEVAAGIERRVGRDGVAALAAALAEAGRRLDRPVVLIDPAGPAIAASSVEHLRTGRVRRAALDAGDVEIEIAGPAGISTIVVRGAPTYAMRDAGGRGMGTLVALPPEAAGDRAPEAGVPIPVVPAWVIATGSVAAAGLMLTFALSRRILRPIGELTLAVNRMETGDLAARAERAAAGRDEVGALARSFNAMAARLAEHERARRQMVADVAHELRSPVTNLRCTLESIQDGLATADRAAIDALHDETMFLHRLIADLQDLTLAEAGRLALHIEAVDVLSTVRRVVGTDSAAPSSIVTDVPADLPPVAADAVRFEQILRNLLSNARRHAGQGSPVSVRARAEKAKIRIEVTDAGGGIAPEHLPHVFDRFYRADQSRSRSTGGAGLGLAIVRHLVEAQGGSVEAASGGLGRGATFSVELPAFLPPVR